MPTVTNDVIRIVAGYTYTSGGSPMSNVLHFVDTGSGSISDADLLTSAGLILEIIFADLHALAAIGLKYTEYSVQNLTQDVIIGAASWPTFVAGLAPGGIASSQVSLLLRMPTSKPKVQGRVFIPGNSEDEISSSVFDATTLAAGLTAGVFLLSNFLIAPSQITYTVFNQFLKTFNFPNSTVVGNQTRALTRRREGD